ncbi:metalloendopeptidase [Caerostris extrusa]|uniref:Metalloendopeptidase n=1 Tax=Caerostris extrusa TaxID=172846 RepID=A0AAV4MS50_CAEEX|nr:metalloendopeptidase [Caerostris extrusa]
MEVWLQSTIFAPISAPINQRDSLGRCLKPCRKDLQVILCVYAENDFEDFDEKLMLTQLGLTKTENGQLLFEGDIVEDSPDQDPQNAMKALPNKGALWTERIIPYEFYHNALHMLEKNMEGQDVNLGPGCEHSFSSRLFEKNTMITLDPRLQTLIGSSRGITFRDAKLANMIYSCDDGCPNKGTLHCQNEGYISPYKGDSKPCTCVCPPNTKGQNCETVALFNVEGTFSKKVQYKPQVIPTGIQMRAALGNIKAPVGKRVQVTFEDFSFRSRMDKPSNKYNGYCVYEYVEIRTSNMEEGDFYCGEDISKGTQLVSSSNAFLILIKADTKGQGRGFKAVVKFI